MDTKRTSHSVLIFRVSVLSGLSKKTSDIESKEDILKQTLSRFSTVTLTSSSTNIPHQSLSIITFKITLFLKHSNGMIGIHNFTFCTDGVQFATRPGGLSIRRE